jgi:AhpD family alkylhydroperoxidase
VTSRLDPFAKCPEAMKAMMALETYVAHAGLDHSPIHLVKIRASQINGCAYCVHMHTREARAAGEMEKRIYLLSAWRDSPLFTARERAALGWTEALTLLPQTHAPDADYDLVEAEFAPDEIVKLSLLVATINAWNRIVSGFRSLHPVERSQG